MYSVLVSPPLVEPVTLEEAKAQCRVLHDAEDDLITGLIGAARQYAEEYTRRAFISQTWRATLPAFPRGPIRLPRPPLISVESLMYTDGAGASVALAGYQTEASLAGALLYPAYGESWPTTRDSRGAVVVEYTAGYGDTAASVPHPIRQAILIGVEDLYQNRGRYTTGTIVAEIPTVGRLLSMYRLPTVP